MPRTNGRHICFCSALWLAVSSVYSVSYADTAPTPYMCIGYNPEVKTWDPVGARPGVTTEENCPAGFALMALRLPVGPERPGYAINPVGTCCRLPDSVLTDEHSYAETQCPVDTVATGTRAERQTTSDCIGDVNFKLCMDEWNSMKHYFRCTKVDTSRFQVRSPSLGMLIGFNNNVDTFFRDVKITTRSRIPLALRYGLVRFRQYGLDHTGFVGFPWGSLVVGKRSKREIDFAPIEYKGNVGDPKSGTLLKTYPDCDYISDILDPNAKCVTAPPAGE